MSSHHWAGFREEDPGVQGLSRRVERGDSTQLAHPWTLQRGPSPSSTQVPSPSLAFLTCEVRGWFTAPPEVTLIHSLSSPRDGASL